MNNCVKRLVYVADVSTGEGASLPLPLSSLQLLWEPLLMYTRAMSFPLYDEDLFKTNRPGFNLVKASTVCRRTRAPSMSHKHAVDETR